MAETPLELYEEAYRLHYHEKKIPEAVRIYEAIIRDFPDSNECGYAFIQLQKVKANDISKVLKKGPATLYPLLIIAFMSSFIALIVAIIGTLFLFQQLRLEHHRATLAIAALSKMYSGKEDDALKIIDELKTASPLDILTSELSTDILSKKISDGRFLPQSSADTAAKISGTENAAANKMTPPKPPAARARANAPYRRPARQNRNPIIYSADSISYF
jgi:hypothetical protein